MIADVEELKQNETPTHQESPAALCCLFVYTDIVTQKFKFFNYYFREGVNFCAHGVDG